MKNFFLIKKAQNDAIFSQFNNKGCIKMSCFHDPCICSPKCIHEEYIPTIAHTPFIVPFEAKKIRNEVHSRTIFAYQSASFFLKKITQIERSGNILSSKWTKKFLQARRIYIHYTNEYQTCTGLSLTN